MTVVETLGPLSFLALRWRRGGCPCGAFVVLRSSWGSRCLRLCDRERIQVISKRDRYRRGHAIASHFTVGLTEAMLARWHVDPQMEQVLLGFFYKDEHILVAARKNLILWIQDQIALYEAAWRIAIERRCPRATFVPSDPHALRLLRCWQEARQTRGPEALEIVEHTVLLWIGRLRSTLWSWLVGIGLLAKGLMKVMRQGVVWRRPTRRTFRVALPNHHGVSKRPQDVGFADVLVDGQRLRREEVLLLVSGSRHDVERLRDHAVGITRAKLFGPPVPLSYLLRVLPRLLRAARGFWAPGGAPHTLLRRRTAGAILHGLSFEVLLHHYAIGVLLNAEEYFSQHVIETVVLNRWGARTAWIPQTVTYVGHQTAYLHYDLLPIQGWCPVGPYGKTWSRRMTVRPVGVLWNDAARRSDAGLVGGPARRIIEDAKAGGRIVGAFPGSYFPDEFLDEFLMEENQRFLRVLAMLVERDERLRVVIRPKASPDSPHHSDFLFAEPFRGILEQGVKDRKIFILNPRDGPIGTAQYLIEASDVVVSTGQYEAFGSVWVEALLLGKPSYVLAAPEFRGSTPAPEFFDEWLFDDEKALADTLIAALQDPPGPGVDERIRHLFDPYNDGRAIERFREEIIALTRSGRAGDGARRGTQQGLKW